MNPAIDHSRVAVRQVDVFHPRAPMKGFEKRRQCMQSPQRSRHFYKSLHCWKIGLLHKFRDEELILQAGIPDVRSQTRLCRRLHAGELTFGNIFDDLR